ncbi:MAG: response regulator [Candidatus Promineifilaceae bacterium]
MAQSVLVVDDEQMARTMLRLILVRAGFEVFEAKDGYEALAEVQRQLPDLVILDIMMPGMDGFAVCEALRKDDRSADVPIIMLSARADSESVVKGLQVGATHYMTKPVNPEELTRQVRETLSVRNQILS